MFHWVACASDVSHLSVAACRPHGIDRVLAHVLCDMLAAVSWCDEALPNVPTNYGGIRVEESVSVMETCDCIHTLY